MKHVFFDLDRTLWDFETNSKNALAQLFVEHELGSFIKSFDSFYNAYKETNARLWNSYGKGKISKEVLRVKRFEDTLRQYQYFDKELAVRLGDEYVAISPHQTVLFPNAKETLESLANANYRLHIITNGFKEVQSIKLQHSGIIAYFDVVLCSEEVGMNKPDPRVFRHAMERSGAKPEESVMIGDDFKVDILGAVSAGMDAVLFDPHLNYKPGTHEWQVNDLSQIPGMLTWIR